MPEKLNPKQEAFVREYLVDLNATQAAIRAGYSKRTAKQQGSRLLTHADIAAAVEAAKGQRVKRVLTKQDRALRQMLAIAESDMRDVATWDETGVRFKYSEDIDPRAAAAIQSVKSKRKTRTDEDGTEFEEVEMEIKLHPKVPMIRTLAEHLGMLQAPPSPIHVNMPVLVIGDPRGWQGAPPDDGHALPPELEAKMIPAPKKGEKKRPKVNLGLGG